MQAGEPYTTIYKKLLKVIPNLIVHLNAGATSGKSKLSSPGMMDLNFDFLEKDNHGNYIIALSHYYRQNGDSIADPDMQIKVTPELEMAEALTYQDTYRYQEVYAEIKGQRHVNLKLKKSLNVFLNTWLSNLIQQGHLIDLSRPDSMEDEANDDSQDGLQGNNATNEIEHNKSYDEKTDILANEFGVYTKETAGDKLEEVDIKFSKSSKFTAKIEIAQTSVGDFKFGFNIARNFGDYSGFGFAPRVDGESYPTRNDALRSSLLSIIEHIDADPKQWKHGNALAWKRGVIDSIKDFAISEGIDLDERTFDKTASFDSDSFSSETSHQNEAAIPNRLSFLQPALWNVSDNHHPVNKVLVDGVAYHLSRLRTLLISKVKELPLEKQLIIAKMVGAKFTERRPLENYLKSNLALAVKNVEHRSSLAIGYYLDDIIIDQRLFHESGSGNSVLSYIIQLLIPADDEDRIEHRHPWQMTRSEFADYVSYYIERFQSYPVDVLEMFDVAVRLLPGGDKYLTEKASVESGLFLSNIIHLFHVTQAFAKGRDIPQQVMDEYPHLVSGSPMRIGFAATDFKKAETFLALLNHLGMDNQWKICSYLRNKEAPPSYLWTGKQIRIITANNPLTSGGFASFMGIQGNKEMVLKAVAFIEANTSSKADEGLDYIDFDNILCMDPEGPDGGTSGDSPSPPIDTPEIDKEVTKSRNQRTETGSAHESYAAEKLFTKTQHRFSEVTEVPRSSITIKPEIFQGRQTKYAQETVDKIVRDGFDKSQDPIVVWRDEEGKLVVISGHSRWEASRILYELGDKSLETMPVKIYLGTLQEAMDYALLESNRSITQEGLKSDLRAYKFAKDKGYNRAYLQGIFKPESKLKLLEDISHLNETGSFLTYLDTEAEKSFPYLQRNSHWVGLIRKQFPDLTDSHEEEMFKYLYGLNDFAKKSAGKKLAISKGQFFDLIEKKVSRIDYTRDRPLNLDLVVSTSALTDPAKERIREIEKEISKLEQERLEKDELIVRAMKEDKPSLVEKFKARQSEINEIITRKILDKQKIEKEIGILERTSIDLFSDLTFLSKDLTNSTKEEKPNDNKVEPVVQTSPSNISEPPGDDLDRVISIFQEYYEKDVRPTKKQIENVGKRLGIENRGELWEAAELSWLKWYKALYMGGGTFQSKLNRMIRFWNNVQPTYAYSDSNKEIYKQYSTPGPIAAIVAEYTRMSEAKSVFEPSAGNGLFIIGADPSVAHVNEIDATRLRSLHFLGFRKITSYNATQPFPEEMTEAYDVIVTNPPFMKWDDEQFDKDILVKKYFNNQIGLNHHMRLEHVMAGLALRCLRDNGRAAIIILGHVYFSNDGYIAKFRPFFNWLFRYYIVDDIINLNSFKLFNKQGAVEKTMLILISGRKLHPNGVAPTIKDMPQLAIVIDSFQELWERVERHTWNSLDKTILQLQTELAA